MQILQVLELEFVSESLGLPRRDQPVKRLGLLYHLEGRS